MFNNSYKCGHCKDVQDVNKKTHKKIVKKNGSIFYVHKSKISDCMDIVTYHFEKGKYVICKSCECLLGI